MATNEDIDFDEELSESSSSSEEAFGGWGSGGSSARLSRNMEREEKKVERDLKKQMIADRKKEYEKKEAIKKEQEKKDAEKRDQERKEQEKKQQEQERQEMAMREQVRLEAIRMEQLRLDQMQIQMQAQQQMQMQQQQMQMQQQPMPLQPRSDLERAIRLSYAENLQADLAANGIASNSALYQPHAAISGSSSDLRRSQFQASNPNSYISRMNPAQSTERMLYESNNISNTSFATGVPLSNASLASSVDMRQPKIQNLAKEFNDAEPEVPDSVPVSKIIRRIGIYREWTEDEMRKDLESLAHYRIKTVRDVRDMSTEGWKEMTNVIPIVKDLLIKEVARRSIWNRSGNTAVNPQAGIEMFRKSITAQPEMRAPTSTPIDSPDFAVNRKVFQPRNSSAW